MKTSFKILLSFLVLITLSAFMFQNKAYSADSTSITPPSVIPQRAGGYLLAMGTTPAGHQTYYHAIHQPAPQCSFGTNPVVFVIPTRVWGYNWGTENMNYFVAGPQTTPVYNNGFYDFTIFVAMSSTGRNLEAYLQTSWYLYCQ